MTGTTNTADCAGEQCWHLWWGTGLLLRHSHRTAGPHVSNACEEPLPAGSTSSATANPQQRYAH